MEETNKKKKSGFKNLFKRKSDEPIEVKKKNEEGTEVISLPRTNSPNSRNRRNTLSSAPTLPNSLTKKKEKNKNQIEESIDGQSSSENNSPEKAKDYKPKDNFELFAMQYEKKLEKILEEESSSNSNESERKITKSTSNPEHPYGQRRRGTLTNTYNVERDYNLKDDDLEYKRVLFEKEFGEKWEKATVKDFIEVLKKEAQRKVKPRATIREVWGTIGRNAKYDSATLRPRSSPKIKPTIKRSQSEPFLHSWDYTWKGEEAIRARPEPEKITPPINRNDSIINLEKNLENVVQNVQEEIQQVAEPLKEINDPDFVTKIDEDRVIIVSGTVERLIYELIDEHAYQFKAANRNRRSNFEENFFLTYHHFTTAKTVFTTLVQRYKKKHENLPEDVADKLNQSVQLRVIIILKMWLETSFKDFISDKELMESFNDFCNDEVLQSKMSKWGKMLKDTVERKSIEYYATDLRTVISRMTDEKTGIKYEKKKEDANFFRGEEALFWLKFALGLRDEDASIIANIMLSEELILPKSKGSRYGSRIEVFNPKQLYFFSFEKRGTLKKTKGLLDYHPLDIARQLSIIEFELFRNISMREFSNNSWSQNNPKRLENAPNIVKIIEISNDVSFWVATEIVTTGNLKKRITLLKHFISIAECCNKIRFFSGVFEIVTGLSLPCIRRLKETWKGLPQKSIEAFISLEEFCSSDDNFSMLRRQFSRVGSEATLPHLGLFLMDITFINDGNPTFLENGHVNFLKMNILAKTLRIIRICQETTFSIRSYPELRDFLLREKNSLSMKELNRLSRFIEPPNEKRQAVRTRTTQV